MIDFFSGALIGLIVGVLVTCMCAIAHEKKIKMGRGEG